MVARALIALVALVGFGAMHGFTGPFSQCTDAVVSRVDEAASVSPSGSPSEDPAASIRAPTATFVSPFGLAGAHAAGSERGLRVSGFSSSATSNGGSDTPAPACDHGDEACLAVLTLLLVLWLLPLWRSAPWSALLRLQTVLRTVAHRCPAPVSLYACGQLRT